MVNQIALMPDRRAAVLFDQTPNAAGTIARVVEAVVVPYDAHLVRRSGARAWRASSTTGGNRVPMINQGDGD
jgi:hypothetical protein